MKENLEEFNIGSIAKKYNEKNYVFILMNHQNNKLNIYLKTNFNKNKVSKNITYISGAIVILFGILLLIGKTKEFSFQIMHFLPSSIFSL